MTKSTFQLTVPQSLYDAVVKACEQGFADSYLFGALLIGNRLEPRTLTGWRKMRDRKDFMDLIKDLKIELVKPTPYPGDGNRMSASELSDFSPKRRQAA